jgi:hypothetical protein
MNDIARRLARIEALAPSGRNATIELLQAVAGRIAVADVVSFWSARLDTMKPHEREMFDILSQPAPAPPRSPSCGSTEHRGDESCQRARLTITAIPTRAIVKQRQGVPKSILSPGKPMPTRIRIKQNTITRDRATNTINIGNVSFPVVFSSSGKVFMARVVSNRIQVSKALLGLSTAFSLRRRIRGSNRRLGDELIDTAAGEGKEHLEPGSDAP